MAQDNKSGNGSAKTENGGKKYLEDKLIAEEYTLSSFACIVEKTEQTVINWIEIGKKKRTGGLIVLSAAKIPNYIITRNNAIRFFLGLNG